jgi:hypothetical protein
VTSLSCGNRNATFFTNVGIGAAVAVLVLSAAVVLAGADEQALAIAANSTPHARRARRVLSEHSIAERDDIIPAS